MQISCTQLDQLSDVAEQIVAQSKDRKHWLFQGEMGAGKTTTIKAICQTLKVIDHVSSPTYSLVNEYRTKDDSIIYHFDFYRLRSSSEARDFGIEEYLDSGNLCLMEWSDKISTLLPENCFTISITSDLNTRNFILN